MQHLLVTTVTLGVAILLCSGCGPQRTGLAVDTALTATPTWAAVPTFTPTPILVASDTVNVAPTATEIVPSLAVPDVTMPNTETIQASVEPVLLPTATPSAEPRLIVNAELVNVRRGPGTAYEQIGVAVQNAQFALTGRNEPGDWWQVCCFDGQPGWLYAPLVEVQHAEGVTVQAEVPPPPAVVAAPTPLAIEEPVAITTGDEPESPAAESVVETAPVSDTPVIAPSGTAGNFDPNAQYQIIHYRVLGFDDNNGGIFNKGAQQLIFISVLDQNGQGVDGVLIKDAVGDKLNVVSGSKGPGKAEVKMDWDPYKLYIATDGAGPVTSQISNQMNNPYPHIPDIIGKMGPVDNEYAICPTADDRCEPPFYHAHWSYEITFQKVK